MRPAIHLAKLIATGILLFAAGYPLAVGAAEKDLAEQGRKLLGANCARCHAMGKDDASPFKEAPPFRDLHKKYPVSQLAEALAEGIASGHPAMPEFVFQPAEIDGIIAFLDSFRVGK